MVLANEESPFPTPDLLWLLTSTSNVSADVIRQFNERGDDEVVDVLADLETADLETDELLRFGVIAQLEEFL